MAKGKIVLENATIEQFNSFKTWLLDQGGDQEYWQAVEDSEIKEEDQITNFRNFKFIES